ncbi:hypothetical protein BJP36_36390 [Moorena producens JHB]|uniref:Uncharacterized protein n=1 Tax=Moorena producens (strain JHB) TaxID=1454205 RepID=A0A9Q9STW8_MOOP1|nr:hypothetical protein [Moorena producens]WAN69570.1 hypothetical protein BJP36_36390 [Moorena producens JHB]
MNNSTSSTPKRPTLQLKDVTTLVGWAVGSTWMNFTPNVGRVGCWFNLDEFHTTGITAVMGFWANK